MKALKIITYLNIIVVLGVICASYINGLGCSFTLRHWLTSSTYDIYTTCSNGIINVKIAARSPYEGVIGEFSGRYFSLNGHSAVLIDNVYHLELNDINQFPFKVNLERNKVLFSSIKRFDDHWVGLFSDYPKNVAFLATIDGYLSIEDRIRE